MKSVLNFSPNPITGIHPVLVGLFRQEGFKIVQVKRMIHFIQQFPVDTA
jgi:hypothetical protein